MRKIRTSAAVVAALAALVPAACGSGKGAAGGGANVDTSGVLAGAYQKVLAVHSADLAMDVTVNTANGTTEHVTGTGAIQWQPLLGSMQISLPLGGSTPASLDIRLVGDTVYVQVPPAFAAHLGGKSWLSSSLSSLVNTGQDTSLNPADTLALLASYASSVTKVGTPMVGGVATTEYTADIDLTRAVSAAASPAAARMIPVLRQMLGSDTLPVSVWVDGSGRLVRFQMDLTLAHAPSGAPAAAAGVFPIKESITETLSDYGVAVDVTAPPADQTMPIDLGSILQQAEGS